ncbi:MAG: hypothetical protein V1660_03580 [archaeon]
MSYIIPLELSISDIISGIFLIAGGFFLISLFLRFKDRKIRAYLIIISVLISLYGFVHEFDEAIYGLFNIDLGFFVRVSPVIISLSYLLFAVLLERRIKKLIKFNYKKHG